MRHKNEAATPKTSVPQDTSAETQRNTIVKLLQESGQMTTLDARANGIMHPAMRVCELRKQGHNIVTNWAYQTDEAGVEHRVGIYTLDGGLKK